MDPMTLVAVPGFLTLALSQLFNLLKGYVLEPYVPGFRLGDAGHDRNLRLLFGALEFAGVLGFVLSGRAGVALPTDWYGWVVLLYVVANSAGLLTGVAHLAYVNGRLGGDSSIDTPSDPTAPEAISQPIPLPAAA